MAVLSYITNILFVIFLLVITVICFPFFVHNYPLELYYRDSVIYTTQSTVILAISFLSVFAFTTIKILYIAFTHVFFVKDIITCFKKPFLDAKRRNENILDNIIRFKKNGEYKRALQITSGNFKNSNEILFQHLFLLLKLKKTRLFLRLFKYHQCGKAIPLFFALIKDWPTLKKNFVISRLYKQNPNNDVISYIYAKHLTDKNKTESARKIIDHFLQNKFIFFREQYTFYLFNKLALKLEMSQYGSTDFATTYIENMQSYHRSHVQKKKKNK